MAQMLARIGTLYDKAITEPIIDIWDAVMSSVTDDDLRDALNRHVADPDAGRFMPKPADIIRQLSGTWAERGMMAWTVFERAFMRHGPYQPIVFEDKRIHAVIESMGGMGKITNASDRDWPFVAREFQQRYAAMRTLPDAEFGPLLGAGNNFQLSGKPLLIREGETVHPKPTLQMVVDNDDA
jgi:hypothetical protein